MQRILLFTILMVAFTFSLFAQRNCSAMDVLEVQIQQDPQRLERMEAIESFTQEFARRPATSRATITIPVVVNVLYNGSAENISDAQIQSQIDVLNEDFRRTNSDADNTWSQASDTEIEFCLASVDPSGNSTSGIRRKSTNKRDWRTNDDMKKANKGGLDPWDASQYMNMWVCDIKGGILGYAQFPGGPASTDGIVIDYAYFGRGGSAQAPFDLGRTATHEVGHYLNLRHIWGDGPCSADDFVGDTPTSDGANYGCAAGSVSCSSTDMVENYMDYSDDACMNLYTAGQKTRMRALFASGGARASLGASAACGGGNPPVDPTCTDGIQNGNETGVDCGGPDCDACPVVDPTCTDGIQNGSETGVDCGGPDCDACPTASCDAPTGLGTTSRKRGREANLNWSAVSGATSYFVEFRAQGASGWQSTTTTSTTTRATGLSRGSGYEFRVTANCNGGSATSGIHTFTAGSSSRIFGDVAGLSVFPNPASYELNVNVGDLYATTSVLGFAAETTTTETLQLSVVDVSGRKLLTQTIDGEQDLATLNTSRLTNGVYFLTVTNTKGELVGTTRFLISH